MTGWHKFIGYNLKGGLSNYICVGRVGLVPGTATENFQAVYGTTWMEQPYVYKMDAFSVVLTYGGSILNSENFGSLAEPPKAIQG